MDTDDVVAGNLPSIRRSLRIIVLLLFGVVFYFAKDLIMPILLGLLITLTLTPLVRGLRKIGLPAGISALVVILTVGSVLGVGGYLLADPVSELIESAPSISSRLKEKLSTFKDSVDTIGSVSDQVDSALSSDVEDDSVTEVAIKQPGLISSATSSFMSALTSLAVAMLMALFMLGSGDLFYKKLVAVMPALSEKKRALKIVYDVENNVSSYLFTITLINITLGLVIGSALFAYGMPSAPLWGVIAAVMNFLPFIGALIGAALLACASLGHFDGLGPSLIPPAIYLFCSTLEGNFLTPLIVGHRLKMNVVAVFLTVAIWGWLWGVAGALMAVPLLVTFKVLCEHVDDLALWAEFLSGNRVDEH